MAHLPLFLLSLGLLANQTSPCPTNCSYLTNVTFPFGTAPGCGVPGFLLSCPPDRDASPPSWQNASDHPFHLLSITQNDPLSGHGSALVRDGPVSNCSSLTNSLERACPPNPQESDMAEPLIHTCVANSKQSPWPPFSLQGLSANFNTANNSYLLLGCQEINSLPLRFLHSQILQSSQHCQVLERECNISDAGFVKGCIEVLSFNAEQLPIFNQLGCKTYMTISGVSSLDQNLSSVSFDMEISWNLSSHLVQDCNRCQQTDGNCGYDVQKPSTFDCFCGKNTLSNGTACNPVADGCKSGKKNNLSNGMVCNPVAHRCKSGICRPGIKVALAVGMVLVGVMACGAAFCFYKTRRSGISRASIPKSEYSDELMQIFTNQIGPMPTKLFTYRELEEATKYFSEKRMTGVGGFGAVYEGRLHNGSKVAVKKLYHDNHQRRQQFFNEIRILSCVQHPNLVKLFGVCFDDKELLLVYEYISNGTLADHLHGDGGKGMLWETRLNIAIETAEALCYLHYSMNPPIFHRDVKSSNILLDEKFHAKVADFGLSRLVPSDATHVSTVPQGTPGYLDPDYHRCYQLTQKSDVYSFGVVLMEIISAKLPVDMARSRKEINLANFGIAKIQNGELEEFIDPNLQISVLSNTRVMVMRVAELALLCVSDEKDDRPTMKEVAEELSSIREYGYGSRGAADAGGGKSSNTKLHNRSYSPISVQAVWSSSSTATDSSFGYAQELPSVYH